jgi:hypothetical protein
LIPLTNISRPLPPDKLLEPDEDFTKMIIEDVESVGFGCKPLSYDHYKKVRQGMVKREAMR